MSKPNGRYKRLVESQRRKSTVSLQDIKNDSKHTKEDEELVDFEQEDEKLASKAFNKADARRFAAPEIRFYVVGTLGCVLAGGVFPAWGIVFAEVSRELSLLLLVHLDDKNFTHRFPSDDWTSILPCCTLL